MLQLGTVIYVDPEDQSGRIIDVEGREFHFIVEECVKNRLPTLWSIVSFEKDEGFTYFNVATKVKISRLYLKTAERYLKIA